MAELNDQHMNVNKPEWLDYGQWSMYQSHLIRKVRLHVQIYNLRIKDSCLGVRWHGYGHVPYRSSHESGTHNTYQDLDSNKMNIYTAINV